FLSCYCDPRALPPFPTRRSSDLGAPAVRRHPLGDEDIRGIEQRVVLVVSEGLARVAADEHRPERLHRERGQRVGVLEDGAPRGEDRKSTRLNSSHVKISYAVFCL